MVALNMDREEGNERMVAEVYTAAAVREAAKRCVSTVASRYTHAEVGDPHTSKPVCSRFGHLACADHRATEEIVKRDWLKRGPKDDVDSPHHFFLAPDGRHLFDRVWTLPPEDLVKLIDRAVLACDPATLAAWDTTEARLARVSDPIDCVRAGALRDLIGAHDAAVDAHVLEIVRRTDDKDVARDALAAFAADLTPARSEGIRKLLAAPAPVVRAQAAGAVAAQKGKESFDALCAAFAKERHGETRCVLLRALAVAGGDPAETREIVLKALKSGDPLLHVHAAVALAPWAREDAVVEALRKLPANEKVPVNLRAAAAWTLGLSGRKEIADDIRPAADDRQEVLRRTAQAAIARLTSGAGAPDYVRYRDRIAPLDVWLREDVGR
jgi:HEAT repeat protein